MTDRITLSSISDMTLANAGRVAFDQACVDISADAANRITSGRSRFELYMREKGGYVYGSTTAPGSHAKKVLSEEDSLRQGKTLRGFLPVQAGPADEMLSGRCVRLAAFARLSNVLSGSGKLRLSTAQALTTLLHIVPPVPLESVACSGEVMPLTWLMAPLADLPLEMGEAMALINGSPFATAMACDVALTMARRLRLAEHIFALSIEGSRCPAAHFDPRLADGWIDPYYEQSLKDINELLAGSQRDQLKHQAPTCWRVLPNVLADALRAVAEVSRAAQIGLQSLKDNPTFIQSAAGSSEDAVLSSSGYHDHRAAKTIDAVNNILVDLCVLVSRQVSHLLDGAGLGLPPLLAGVVEGVGAEYLAWGMTEPLATARRASQATTLDLGLQDPNGNQSDVTSLAFLAYQKHRDAARCFDVCFASLAVTASLALGLQARSSMAARTNFQRRLYETARSGRSAGEVVGESWRQAKELIRLHADEMPTASFAECVAMHGERGG
jgi:histidine ammonia-lyase